MKSKNLMTVFAIMLVSLSMIGFTYAAWYDKLTIDVEAEMGELIVGILTDRENELRYVTVLETTNSYPEDGTGAPPKEEPGGFDPKPWVADTTVDLDCFQTAVHHEEPATVAHCMYITIDNAYPQYDVHIFFPFKNAGTIPAVYVGAVLSDNLVETSWGYDPGLSAWVWEGFLIGGDPDYERVATVKLVAFLPEDGQTHGCNEYPCEIHIDFLQTAKQCHTYEFVAEFTFVQWNLVWKWPE